MPITLYEAAYSAPCQAVKVVAKALNLDLVSKEINLMADEQKTPEFLKMNPAHCIPTLDDNGLYLWESRAIMAYFINQYGKDDKLYPKDPKKRALVDNLLQFDLGALYGSFAEYFYPPIFHKQPESAEAKAKVQERLSILDGILSKRQFVTGDSVTIADISIMCSLHTPIGCGFDLSPYSNITSWRERCKKALPFFDEVTSAGVESFTGFVKQLRG
ncbi:Glutathione S-transferase [Chamberlinius hualienensis]